MIYGYARCSTDDTKQDVTYQKRELKEMGAKEENIYFEYESGTKTDREQLNILLEKLNAGDTLVTTELSRITRSTRQLYDIIEFAKENKIKLVIGTFIVDCSKEELDPMTEGMLKMMGVFAEMERNMTSKRVKSGLKNAVAKGKILGRPQTTIENIPDNVKKFYDLFEKGKINKTEYARMCDISRPSLDKYLKIIKD